MNPSNNIPYISRASADAIGAETPTAITKWVLHISQMLSITFGFCFEMFMQISKVVKKKNNNQALGFDSKIRILFLL